MPLIVEDIVSNLRSVYPDGADIKDALAFLDMKTKAVNFEIRVNAEIFALIEMDLDLAV